MKILRYFRKLIEANSQDSSKRFLALYTMILVSYTVFRFTNKENAITILELLLGFILVIMGVAVWQSIKKKEP
jgi:hypothetical protein